MSEARERLPLEPQMTTEDPPASDSGGACAEVFIPAKSSLHAVDTNSQELMKKVQESLSLDKISPSPLVNTTSIQNVPSSTDSADSPDLVKKKSFVSSPPAEVQSEAAPVVLNANEATLSATPVAEQNVSTADSLPPRSTDNSNKQQQGLAKMSAFKRKKNMLGKKLSSMAKSLTGKGGKSKNSSVSKGTTGKSSLPSETVRKTGKTALPVQNIYSKHQTAKAPEVQRPEITSNKIGKTLENVANGQQLVQNLKNPRTPSSTNQQISSIPNDKETLETSVASEDSKKVGGKEEIPALIPESVDKKLDDASENTGEPKTVTSHESLKSATRLSAASVESAEATGERENLQPKSSLSAKENDEKDNTLESAAAISSSLTESDHDTSKRQENVVPDKMQAIENSEDVSQSSVASLQAHIDSLEKSSSAQKHNLNVSQNSKVARKEKALASSAGKSSKEREKSAETSSSSSSAESLDQNSVSTPATATSHTSFKAALSATITTKEAPK